ncbi:unnamed protein product [Lampetra fluviatilis]
MLAGEKLLWALLAAMRELRLKLRFSCAQPSGRIDSVRLLKLENCRDVAFRSGHEKVLYECCVNALHCQELAALPDTKWRDVFPPMCQDGNLQNPQEKLQGDTDAGCSVVVMLKGLLKARLRLEHAYCTCAGDARAAILERWGAGQALCTDTDGVLTFTF